MSELSTRLRAGPASTRDRTAWQALANEAADEIDRLRAELTNVKYHYGALSNAYDATQRQLVKRTDGLKRIERGATSVLLDATLNDDPINPDVLKEILKDIANALTDDHGDKK